jgi:hypothetical protein
MPLGLPKIGQPLDDRLGAYLSWPLPQFAYRDITLLDRDRRIPTLDCIEMEKQAHSELALREQRGFEALRNASEQVIGRQDDAYFRCSALPIGRCLGARSSCRAQFSIEIGDQPSWRRPLFVIIEEILTRKTMR